MGSKVKAVNKLCAKNIYVYLKFGDGDGPNLCRVKK